jgi:hypothetical protein
LDFDDEVVFAGLLDWRLGEDGRMDEDGASGCTAAPSVVLSLSDLLPGNMFQLKFGRTLLFVMVVADRDRLFCE